MNSVLTVTTPAENQELTDLESVKQELGITTTAEDTKFGSWIKQASSIISSYCNRVFGSETVSETFRLERNPQKIVLTRFPVSVISSVLENDISLTTDDYESDLAKGMLTRLSSDSLSCWAACKIVVSYRGGYDLLDDLPDDIQRACISLVRQLRSQSTRDPLAKRIEIPDVRTVDYWVGQVGESGSMPPDVMDILAPYVNARL